MSKLILFNMVTVDGFFEGPNKEIDWHNVDNEFNDFAVEQLNSAELASTFRRLGLIDEYRIMVNPVLLGKGNPLF